MNWFDKVNFWESEWVEGSEKKIKLYELLY